MITYNRQNTWMRMRFTIILFLIAGCFIPNIHAGSINSERTKSVATDDSQGVVTGVSEGAVVVTATTTDGSDLTAICEVVVTDKSAVDPTGVDGCANARIYNVDGVLVHHGPDGISALAPGIYTVIQNGKTYKVIVK